VLSCVHGYVLNINRYRGSIEGTKTQKERPPKPRKRLETNAESFAVRFKEMAPKNVSNRLRSEDSEHEQSNPITSQPLSENKPEPPYNSYTIIGLKKARPYPLTRIKQKSGEFKTRSSIPAFYTN